MLKSLFGGMIVILMSAWQTPAKGAINEEKIVLSAKDFDPVYQLGMNAHLSQMSAVPQFQSGKYAGVKLMRIQKGSFWDFLKFADDDVVCGVDGNENVDASLLLSIPDRLRQNRRLQICRIRAGSRTSLFYSVEGQSSEAVRNADGSTKFAERSEQDKNEHARRLKQYDANQAELKKSAEAIALNAKQNPDKSVSCRVQWKDATGVRDATSVAKAGDLMGWPCLTFCMKTLEKNGVVVSNHAYPTGTFCFSDANPQGFPRD